MSGANGNSLHCHVRRAFINGVLYGAQFMAIDHHEESFAEDMLRNSGFSRRDLLNAQRRSGYESRFMNKIIKCATPNGKDHAR